MATADEDFLRGFHQNLVDGPLEPDDRRYVAMYSRTSADPVLRLARKIEWKQHESTQLFSGFRGTGKSTELRRLRKVLSERGFKVVLCDMQKYINLSSPIEVSDFLISTAGAISDALSEDPELLGDDLAQRGYWQRAVDFFTRTQIAFDSLPIGSKAGDASGQLKLALKDDPSFREQLQTKMKGRLGALADDVRSFMADVVKAIRDKHEDEGTQLVVLLDSIEQIRGTSADESDVFASVESLFAGHPDKLKFDSVHLVYTVPPWLKIRSPGVAKYYDGSETLPCVKLRERDGTRCDAGLEILDQIVRGRGDWTRLLTPEDFERVRFVTGGYLRDLFKLLQNITISAPDHDARPLSPATIDYEIAVLRNGYMPLAHEDSRWLARVARSHEAELAEHSTIPRLSRLFDTHLLLCYRNGQEWYGIHPLLQDEVDRVIAADTASATESSQPEP